jgi:hypothetical protein
MADIDLDTIDVAGLYLCTRGGPGPAVIVKSLQATVGQVEYERYVVHRLRPPDVRVGASDGPGLGDRAASDRQAGAGDDDQGVPKDSVSA